MDQAQLITHYTLDEYLVMEAQSKIRHEFIDGEIFSMVGSSRTHNSIVTNLVIMIGSHLRGTSCRVASNDMKVVIASANRAYYPDVLVSCNNPSDESDDYTETHPRLIIEVLSPSTEAIDRREKRIAYQQCASLEDYVLVAQAQRVVTVYSRQLNGWIHKSYREDERVELPSIDLQILMSAIYENVAIAADKS